VVNLTVMIYLVNNNDHDLFVQIN